MKKTAALLALALVLSLILAGCGNSSSDSPASSDTGKTAATKYLSVGTGSVTGVYYPLGGALASIVTNQIDGYNCAAESTGGAVENAGLLIGGKLDLGFVAASTLHDAQNGLNSFEGKDGAKVQALFSFFPEVVQILSVNPDIRTIPDLKGKRVAVGSAGSGTEVMARAILEIYDMSYDDIEEDFLGFGDAATGLKDGTCDAAFTWAGIPTASVMELCATHSISMISFSDEELEKLMTVSTYCVP
ncbi:MAG: TAXI family TRAP transporter solute-binding subunit, partial [Oscillospiraceae bacterium]|nr:TAXI family TRAP transporter solute-binding subunit [Oscillospiraceae bacterium]